jgi:hypothetical protein
MFKRFFQARADRRREEEEKRRQQFEQHLAALLSPRFEEIEKKFGRPISPALRALYENREEIVRSNVTKVVPGVPEDQWISIAAYYPLDAVQAEGGWQPDGVHFAFAGDGSGSEWVVVPTDDHAEIQYLEHETGELKPTGVRMCDFLRLRDDVEG